MTAILALDIGVTTGYALLHPDGSIHHGARNFGDIGHGAMFHKLREFLNRKHDQIGGPPPAFDLVAYEDISGAAAGQLRQQRVWGGFRGVLLGWCFGMGIEVRGVHIGTAKKAVTGSGKASKAEVRNVLAARGFETKTEDESDALSVLFAVAPERLDFAA